MAMNFAGGTVFQSNIGIQFAMEMVMSLWKMSFSARGMNFQSNMTTYFASGVVFHINRGTQPAFEAVFQNGNFGKLPLSGHVTLTLA